MFRFVHMPNREKKSTPYKSTLVLPVPCIGHQIGETNVANVQTNLKRTFFVPVRKIC